MKQLARTLARRPGDWKRTRRETANEVGLVRCQDDGHSSTRLT
jgi:hypothetical protein